MKKARKTILIAGAQGVTGRAAAEHFSKQADIKVYGISRRNIEGLENVQPISADLTNPTDTRKMLGGLEDVTHVVFGAYVEKETPTERLQAFNTSPFTRAAKHMARILDHLKPLLAKTTPG
jgi:NAD(P)-dependent dehydrogenase (short-subunit alcohol dehydrogenase family)